MTNSLSISAEYQVLLQTLGQFRDELAVLIADRDVLVNKIIPMLEAEYQVKIGILQYDLLMVKVEALRKRRKIELIQACVNRKELITMDDIENTLDREFEKWHEEINTLYERITMAQYHLNSFTGTLSAEDIKELRTLYLSLAKKLHPDLNPAFTEEIKALWLQVTDAYARSDLAEMRTLALLAGDFAIREQDLSAIDTVRQIIEDIKKRIHFFLGEISQRKSMFPYTIRNELQDAAWIESQKESLNEEMAFWLEQTKHYENILADLLFEHTPFPGNGPSSITH